jgi:hypothetical protein
LVPLVTLRTTWTAPYWIKDSLFQSEKTSTNATGKGVGFDGLRIGGLTIHTLGRFDSPESAYSETGLANDVDLEACYEMDLDKPLTALQSRDRVFALPLGFKCSRRILLSGHHSCTVTAEIVQHRRKSEGLEETPASTRAGVFADAESKELEAAWRIMMVFSGSDNQRSQYDHEFFADSMQGNNW